MLLLNRHEVRLRRRTDPESWMGSLKGVDLPEKLLKQQSLKAAGRWFDEEQAHESAGVR
jgi:hypothetical protein